MPSVFTKVFNGELPGRLVYRDDRCAALLTIAPLQPGHTLVVPLEEIDNWTDLPEDLMLHLFSVARKISQALESIFTPEKVGLMIAGLEVRHVHLHLVPIRAVHDLDFSRQQSNPDPAMMDQAMHDIRAKLGWSEPT